MKKIIIIGGGTFSTVVIDLILENEKYRDYAIQGFLDDGKICDENYEYPHLGKIDDIYSFAAEDTFFVTAIGSPKIRKMIAEKYHVVNYLTLIEKSANVSNTAVIGKGSIVLKGAVINAFAKTGEFVIINSGAVVDHHSEIGSYSHIGQGAVLWHSAKINEEEHLPPGTVIKG